MRKLDLSMPPESDRIIGVTIPREKTFYICDHDEVWRVLIGATPTIEVTDDQPYEFVKARADFLGLVFKGLSANAPLLRVGPNEIACDFDPKMDFVIVNYKVAGQSGQIEFPTLSGDWFAGSFSDDGGYMILAEPYNIALYEVT